MFCNKCGKEIESGYLCDGCKSVKYCNDCGKEIESGYLCDECRSAKEKTLSKNVKLCKRCGKEIGAGGSDYCGVCKQDIERRKAANQKTCKNCGHRMSKTLIYCPMCNKMADVSSPTISQPSYSTYDEGSFWAGWWLGFLAGLVGLIIALVIGKSETTRGAKWGFAISIILSVALGLFYGCVVVAAMGGGGYYRYY